MSNNGASELEYVITSKTPTTNNEKPSGSYLPPPPQEQLSYYSQLVENENKMEKLKQLSKKNPFVPIGCLITVGILMNGIFAMKNGDRAKSQRMMRYRVGAQGITILAVLGGTMATQFMMGA
jgi:hypothetical protein